VDRNRVHSGKVGVVMRFYPDKPHLIDVLIDSRVRERVNTVHFEVVEEGDGQG
jgi:hypothetical protein